MMHIIVHPCGDELTAVKTVSADQYHLTVSGAQVLTHRGRGFFESYLLTS